MPSTHLALRRNTRWSWHALVAEHGEERALVMLEYMPGLGSYTDDAERGWAEHNRNWHPTTDAQLHDVPVNELPACVSATLPPPSLYPEDLDLDHLGTGRPRFVRSPDRRQMKLITDGHGTDVGEHCGTPWYGEPT